MKSLLTSEKPVAFEEFVKIILNASRDFFLGKIDEKTLGLLMIETYTSEATKKFHVEPYLWKHNEFLAFVSELTDIDWMKSGSDSQSYEEYISELKVKWKKQVSLYDKYFS